MRSKTLPSIVLATLLTIGLASCSAGPAAEAPAADAPATQIDLTGEWEQSNSDSTGGNHVATFVGDTMAIYWLSDDAVKSLYWAGTVEVPEGATGSFTWDSKNDKSKTGSALLASPADTKTFEFKDGVITYEAAALGQTWTVELRQTSSTPAAAPTGESSSSSDYGVKILGASFASDYQGTSVIVVEFDFTNNSDEAANFMFSLDVQAFQSGIELDSTVIGVDEIDSSLKMADIKPGVSLKVKTGFQLRDASDVTIEVRELFSFDDVVLTEQVFSVGG